MQVWALVVAGFLVLASETAERPEAAALCLYLLLRTMQLMRIELGTKLSSALALASASASALASTAPTGRL